MASTHALATSSTVLVEDSGPQAGPLPSKRGEIGFVEGVHTQPPAPAQPVDRETLPERHPADRPPQDLPSDEAPLPSGVLPVLSDSSSTNTVDKYPCRWHKKLPKFMGVQFMTLLLISVQLSFFAGTIVGWVFAAMALGNQLDVPPPDLPVAQDPPPSDHTSNIFVNIAFAVVVIAQLIVLERRIYRVRAERYAFKHAGEILPTSLWRGQSVAEAMIPVAPWNRPPLPTYAATLAASGVGTGDVEDPEIAPAPPPAYGKTRGSTLILAGFLRDSLLIRIQEHEENRSESGMSDHSDRPASLSSDEGRRSADPACRTEELGGNTSI